CAPETGQEFQIFHRSDSFLHSLQLRLKESDLLEDLAAKSKVCAQQAQGIVPVHRNRLIAIVLKSQRRPVFTGQPGWWIKLPSGQNGSSDAVRLRMVVECSFDRSYPGWRHANIVIEERDNRRPSSLYSRISSIRDALP